MTAIAPNTVIRFGQVNLPKDMSDTFYFANETEQREYFQAFLTTIYTKFTYQREHRNYVKIEINSEQDADEWDYMMFQNTSYGNKWFYAFVTETEWINNLTVKIYYEIDYIQTYLFNYEEQSSWIERTHTRTDEIGDNIVPDITLGGELYNNDFIALTELADSHYPKTNEIYFVLAYLPNRTGSSPNTIEVKEVGNIPTGVNLRYFASNDTSGIQSFVRGLSDVEQVLGIYTAPKGAFALVPAQGGTEYGGSPSGFMTRFTLPNTSTTDRLNGYVPSNKKLYTYPYNFLRIYNDNGEYLDLRYELFNGNPEFGADYSAMQPVSVNIAPTNYLGVHGTEPVTPTLPVFSPKITDKIKKLKLTNYPIGSWTNDTYKQWVAFQGMPQATSSVAKSIVGGIMNPLSLIPKLANTVIDTVTNDIVKFNRANEVAGNLQSGNAEFSSRRKNFYKARMSCIAQDAQIIDNYFTMFGYAINAIDVPSRNARTRFTYIKTVGCVVKGDLPANAKNIIQQRYNDGIRFWADHENIGNYSADNPPL